jgi:hypothetical protein
MVFEFDQYKIKHSPAKGAEEVRSKTIEPLFLSLFSQENGFTEFLRGQYPIPEGAGRLADRESRLDEIFWIKVSGHERMYSPSNMTRMVGKMTSSAVFSLPGASPEERFALLLGCAKPWESS